MSSQHKSPEGIPPGFPIPDQATFQLAMQQVARAYDARMASAFGVPVMSMRSLRDLEAENARLEAAIRDESARSAALLNTIAETQREMSRLSTEVFALGPRPGPNRLVMTLANGTYSARQMSTMMQALADACGADLEVEMGDVSPDYARRELKRSVGRRDSTYAYVKSEREPERGEYVLVPGTTERASQLREQEHALMDAVPDDSPWALKSEPAVSWHDQWAKYRAEYVRTGNPDIKASMERYVTHACPPLASDVAAARPVSRVLRAVHTGSEWVGWSVIAMICVLFVIGVVSGRGGECGSAALAVGVMAGIPAATVHAWARNRITSKRRP